MRRSRLQACFHFLGKRNAVNEQIGSPIEGISPSVTTGGTKIPAELFLGSRKLHLEKRKENINFSKANVVNLKKYRLSGRRESGKQKENSRNAGVLWEWTFQVC